MSLKLRCFALYKRSFEIIKKIVCINLVYFCKKNYFLKDIQNFIFDINNFLEKSRIVFKYRFAIFYEINIV